MPDPAKLLADKNYNLVVDEMLFDNETLKNGLKMTEALSHSQAHIVFYSYIEYKN